MARKPNVGRTNNLASCVRPKSEMREWRFSGRADEKSPVLLTRPLKAVELHITKGDRILDFVGASFSSNGAGSEAYDGSIARRQDLR